MSDISNRNFDHISLEIFLQFLQLKEKNILSFLGVSIIAESLAHKEPLRSNLITCLGYLKEQFYDLLRKGIFTTK